MASPVKQLYIDQYVVGLHFEVGPPKPRAADIPAYLDELDGKAHTQMSLHTADHTRLVIRGAAGKYVVYVELPEQQVWNLLAGTKSRRMVTILPGMEPGEYPARQVVGKALALKAAQTFFATGRLDPNLTWEKQAGTSQTTYH